MLKFPNNGILVQQLSELPDLKGAQRLYLDVETTSGDPKIASTNPWHHCAIAGIAVTADECKQAWYIPIRHHDERWNLPLEPVVEWLRNTVSSCAAWINHNIKYDAHCCAQEEAIFTGELIDTLTLAKLIDSDRVMRGGYGLRTLSLAWLDKDISKTELRVSTFLRELRSKDYGVVPADILGEYACQDVLTNRALYHYILDKMPERSQLICSIEMKVTPVLWDIEQRGVHLDLLESKKKELSTLNEILTIEERLHKITGQPMRPHTNDDCFEVLCNQFGLPILAQTETGNPSFDKAALLEYSTHPLVMTNPKLVEIIKRCLRYRELSTFYSLFLEPYSNLAVGDILHPSYNQTVRTGRMSCSAPNMQQLSNMAKRLIIPAPGYGFLSADYSQIEFRLIVHYIQNPAAIAAYTKNPRTDFHQWVADMCKIPRKPAKHVNFCIGYGGGKKKVIAVLSSVMELVGELMKQAGEDHNLFDTLRTRRAREVYDKYHETLPELRQVTKEAERRCMSRGFVFTAYGRHRHLPRASAWRAFNSLTQGTAADVMKASLVAVSPRYNKTTRGFGMHCVAVVHDEILFEVPSAVPRRKVEKHVTQVMENTEVKFRVPMIVDTKWLSGSWGSD